MHSVDIYIYIFIQYVYGTYTYKVYGVPKWTPTRRKHISSDPDDCHSAKHLHGARGTYGNHGNGRTYSGKTRARKCFATQHVRGTRIRSYLVLLPPPFRPPLARSRKNSPAPACLRGLGPCSLILSFFFVASRTRRGKKESFFRPLVNCVVNSVVNGEKRKRLSLASRDCPVKAAIGCR